MTPPYIEPELTPKYLPIWHIRCLGIHVEFLNISVQYQTALWQSHTAVHWYCTLYAYINQQQWPSATGDGNTVTHWIVVPLLLGHLLTYFIGGNNWHITLKVSRMLVGKFLTFTDKQSSDAVCINYCVCSAQLRTQDVSDSDRWFRPSLRREARRCLMLKV